MDLSLNGDVSLSYLPNEILLLILEKLPIKELITLSAVCKRWNWFIFNAFSKRIVLYLVGGAAGAAVQIDAERKYRNIRIYYHEILFPEPKMFKLRESLTEIDIAVHVLGSTFVFLVLQSCRTLKRLSIGIEVLKIKNNWRAVELAEACSSVVNLSIGIIEDLAPRKYRSFAQLFGFNLPCVQHLYIKGDSPYEMALVKLLSINLLTLQIEEMVKSSITCLLALKLCSLKRLDICITIPKISEKGIRIRDFESFFKHLMSLKSLRLGLYGFSLNAVVTIIFANMCHLEELDLRFSDISILQSPNGWADLQEMKSLKTLILEGYMCRRYLELLAGGLDVIRLNSFVSLLDYCRNLKILDLSGFDLRGSTLQMICVSMSQLEEFSFSIERLRAQTVFRLNLCPKLHTLILTIGELDIETELSVLQNFIVSSSMRVLSVTCKDEPKIACKLKVQHRNPTMQLTINGISY